MCKGQIIIYLLFFILSSSCSSNENSTIEEQLILSHKEIKFSKQAEIDLSCNVDWSTSVIYTGDQKDWLTIAPASGKQGNNQLLTLTANASSIERKATVVFSFANKIETLAVIQSIDEDIYESVHKYQTQYLRSLQIPSGAIKDTPSKESKICPYFANFACLSLLKDPNQPNLEMVRKYIQWYLSKLNGTRSPLTGSEEIEGSIYDYYGEGETTNATYDSVDSYAATFLMLVKEYASLSSDNLSWLSQRRDKLDLVVNALIECIDQNNDGLSFASSRYKVKYLMDNAEVNKGLNDAIWLKEKKLISTSDQVLIQLYVKQKTSIENELWKDNSYNWYATHILEQRSDWNNFYPDATAQLYPILFDVIDSSQDRAKYLYKKFNE